MKALAIGGVEDHVHLFLSLPSTLSIAKAIQLIKGGSSKWVAETFPSHRDFEWQEGYGAFSVSISHIQNTVAYNNDQKITDIYEQCSIDCNKDAEIFQAFFKTVQNKLHWAITGQPAAAIVASRAVAAKPYMGLTTFRVIQGPSFENDFEKAAKRLKM
jgi:hypothetical protein